MAEIFVDVRIGASGWMHSQWTGKFYPEDLPEDWRLSYYADEFSLVMIEEKAWTVLQSDPSLVDELIDEAESGLQYVCEIPAVIWEQQHTLYLPVIEKLEKAGACAGVLIKMQEGIHPTSVRVCALWQELPAGLPCFLDFETPLSADVLSVWQQQGRCSICWRPDQGEQAFVDARCQIVRVKSASLSLKQLRSVIETACRKAGTDATVLFIVDGQPPDTEMMRNAQIIYDLL